MLPGRDKRSIGRGDRVPPRAGRPTAPRLPGVERRAPCVILPAMATPKPTPAAPAPTTAVYDVDTPTFERDVVLRSKTVPVLVDLWATWCGPCKQLSPVLEKIVAEMRGKLVLAKIDIDKNPEVADLFQVQSVPMVVLIKDGKMADGFVGALPEAEIRRFLEPFLGPAANPLERADALEKDGKVADAIALLREHVRAQATDGAARLVLARLLLDQGETEEAQRTFGLLAQADKDSDAGRALAARFAPKQDSGELDALGRKVTESPDDLGARVAWGRALVAAGRHEEGLAALFEAARRDVHHDGDAPRKALVEAFERIGWSNPLVRDAQRRLSLLLAS